MSRSTRRGVPERIPGNGIPVGWTRSQSRFHASEPGPIDSGEPQAASKRTVTSLDYYFRSDTHSRHKKGRGHRESERTDIENKQWFELTFTDGRPRATTPAPAHAPATRLPAGGAAVPLAGSAPARKE